MFIIIGVQYRDTPKRTHYLHKISHLTNRVENSLHYQPNTRFPLKSVGGIQPKNCDQLIDDRRIPVFLENSQLIWSAAHLSYLLTRSATFSAVRAVHAWCVAPWTPVNSTVSVSSGGRLLFPTIT